ncbi:MAG: alpha/beta hydrolase [Acinetobacter sp.]
MIEPLGPNIADEKSAYYDFKIETFRSADQLRTYKVWLAVPKAKKSQARAVLYMLDGNAVMDRLKEPMLKKMAVYDAPVLVAVGYDTQLPFLSEARSVDYTPGKGDGIIEPDPRSPSRMSGGSQAFRDFVTGPLAAWVDNEVKIDSQRIGLWGHSYGGLFVLDSMMNSDYFTHYFAASPSLAWADQRMLNQIMQAKISNAEHKKLWLMEGDSEQGSQVPLSANISLNGIDQLRKAALLLNQQKVQNKLIIYPQLTHGEVFIPAMQEAFDQKLRN